MMPTFDAAPPLSTNSYNTHNDIQDMAIEIAMARMAGAMPGPAIAAPPPVGLTIPAPPPLPRFPVHPQVGAPLSALWKVRIAKLSPRPGMLKKESEYDSENQEGCKYLDKDQRRGYKVDFRGGT